MSLRPDIVVVLFLIMAGDCGFFIPGAGRPLGTPAEPVINAQALWLLTAVKNGGPSPSGPGHKFTAARVPGHTKGRVDRRPHPADIHN